MANILMDCAVAEGHMIPMLNIAEWLTTQGHQIVWVGGRFYEEKIKKSGATFYPMPEALDPKDESYYELYPELAKLKGFEQVKYYYEMVFQIPIPEFVATYQAICEDFKPDVLIGDPATFGLYVFSEITQIPLIDIHVIPILYRRKGVPPFGLGLQPISGWLGRFRDDLIYTMMDVFGYSMKDAINKARAIFELPAHGCPYNDYFNSFARVLLVTVPGLDFGGHGMPDHIQYIGPVMPKPKKSFDLPEWWDKLKTDKKVVLITQGTLANNVDDLMLPAIEALKDEDLMIVAVPFHGSRENLPENVLTAEFIPFADLMPLVDIMVTNGGFGGINKALSEGVPVVISGVTEDKMEVSARVAYSGAGINMKTNNPSPAKVKKAVFEVLNNPSYKTSAEKIQLEINACNPLESVAKAVEEITANNLVPTELEA